MTNVDFFFVRRFIGAFAKGAAQEPAEVAALKFPGWTLFFLMAVFLFPAGDKIIVSLSLVNQQEEELTFDMGGYGPPTLFITVNCLKRHAQEGSELFLSFTQFFSNLTEIRFFHGTNLI